ncbi:pyruvate, phosphate dikinase [Candidatus Desantisbacteria bacterium CG_4_10_14_0_8_um_filter_48_22]|uniref:Pyruvate, phosphate dikinase n=1 Tax=Candidatus Desantisbacteria bacterium CG_4_10_14_0_8_um_filter_48_22 TaxID=1974543 RepID=A0A2M7S4K5_9BACT|nr:MAG: pyruvate, phosphate dikinase [Candidatus Desantisbacteria bacterium CG1_02_49_89]PIV55296.1 MAG: pyruvate, phosphate dikinase [Candidatus Desantisbacteria bacterium CG02_land_8_20_14_3_00_49_13]PIZ14472.1 MAG: pyruvate, phosphate dikinase [Candidatus Desantisbacteria bacterium CG_4_10_14_0_8_um_filter_48_22]
MAKKQAGKKFVYFFGGGRADGNESMKNLLGGKGANLAEMAGHKSLRLPVPPGFTITTEICTYYYENRKLYPAGLKEQAQKAMEKIEALMGRKFGDPENPLLVSVRSGARKSMPGMMETVLNVGLTEKTIPGLVKHSGSERFVYDAYRRLIMMYSDVVMEKAGGIEPEADRGIRKQLEEIMAEMKSQKGYKTDTDLKAADLKELCNKFKVRIKELLGSEFPDESQKQLWGGIGAVFSSWNGKRAVSYRRIEGIPDEWGTAVNVQTMVFGNMGTDSATGVAFTRNPGNGENDFYGEYLINAQGEDVVAGIRTPAPINEYSTSEHNKDLKTLEKGMPKLYNELFEYQNRLERHYHDMQDIEFTIEKGILYMLQCRVGKRNGMAAVRMAMDMVKEKLINKETAVIRVTPSQLDELLHPIIDAKVEAGQKPVAKGLPAGPGGACGQIVFSAKDAVDWQKQGKKVILVREETNPEDVEGMRAAEAILTARGGMTSHAALVARGWGKCCIVGCSGIEVDYSKKELLIAGKTYKEGDWITLNGTKGNVYDSKLPMIDATENTLLNDFLKICKTLKKLGVRTNADTPEDAARARQFGAEGIGLFRTEHMFYGKGADEPLFILRKMIVSKSLEERKKALTELFPFVKKDIKGTLEAMDGLPVVIRLLDPPLHEFVPRDKSKLEKLASELGITMEELSKRAEALHESNPMMGHRGVRLGITYPEVTEMQVRAVFESAAELLKEGKKPYPEIMVPVVCEVKEIDNQKKIADAVYAEVCAKFGLKKMKWMFGTMIEIPRAAFVADELAQQSEFFSYGTNDMTQMGFGFSRDDIGGFLPDYLKKGILPGDPFQSLDQKGIGEIIKIGIGLGRKIRKDLEVGICGEHGGDAESVKFCHRVKMNYVSCSPFRVPIATLAAAQAAVSK